MLTKSKRGTVALIMRLEESTKLLRSEKSPGKSDEGCDFNAHWVNLGIGMQRLPDKSFKLVMNVDTTCKNCTVLSGGTNTSSKSLFLLIEMLFVGPSQQWLSVPSFLELVRSSVLTQYVQVGISK